ncbi:hypothetical protein GQ43DRAFT_431211 [Delitschia confertaspora ATCC 74209]|uniref:Uncharacterized protein n=1 Tax=Delitschia confertaspora ATCC 74209 TaxID=1513339 RepID=A0A9P4JMQ6_9PLEO|nr:hypothetical protein GQ43DRAFT_431211 [Delitschia confertaspora ATCC 74209]
MFDMVNSSGSNIKPSKKQGTIRTVVTGVKRALKREKYSKAYSSSRHPDPLNSPPIDPASGRGSPHRKRPPFVISSQKKLDMKYGTFRRIPTRWTEENLDSGILARKIDQGVTPDDGDHKPCFAGAVEVAMKQRYRGIFIDGFPHTAELANAFTTYTFMGIHSQKTLLLGLATLRKCGSPRPEAETILAQP